MSRLVLETERLLLRELEAGAWLERQRERYARDGHGLWLVVLKETGEPVGQVGLLEQDLGEGARKMGMIPERTIEWRGFTHTVFGLRRPSTIDG